MTRGARGSTWTARLRRGTPFIVENANLAHGLPPRRLRLDAVHALVDSRRCTKLEDLAAAVGALAAAPDVR